MTSRFSVVALVGFCALAGQACGDESPPFVPTGPTGAREAEVEASPGDTTTDANPPEVDCASFTVDAGPFGPFGDVCMPDETDTACPACVRAGCCPEAEACADDPANCSCLLDCFFSGCDPIACFESCGNNDAVSEVISCVTENCVAECVPS